MITTQDDPRTILAYYTLSSRELKLEQLPAEMAKKAGKYGYVGVTLMGRMAVAENYTRNRSWYADSAERPWKSLGVTRDVASWAVFVEAIDEGAANFCRKYGSIELPEDKLKLFFPMKTIKKLFPVF